MYYVFLLTGVEKYDCSMFSKGVSKPSLHFQTDTLKTSRATVPLCLPSTTGCEPEARPSANLECAIRSPTAPRTAGQDPSCLVTLPFPLLSHGNTFLQKKRVHG